jgi:AcrR family transcriptional regulator
MRQRQQWRQSDRLARRDQIIDTALELLHDEGLGQVTMRRVAARLGVGAMTLYTYVRGQDQLRREMIRRGFQKLGQHCRGCTAHADPRSWTPGATAYLEFARANPNLYRLMFSTPSITREDLDIARAGYESLLERVRSLLTDAGLTGQALEDATVMRAGLYWIALHGLASIIIDERLDIIGKDEQSLLSELLPRIAPA